MQTNSNINTKLVNSTKEQQFCVVCYDGSDGLHFGQFSCRACAAFFRRTVSQRLKYLCKREGKCFIDKGARNMCRSCRYEKCLREGMLTSSVQNQNEQSTSSTKNNFLPLLPSESGIDSNSNQTFQYSHLQRMMEGYKQLKSLHKAAQAMNGSISLSEHSGTNKTRSHIDNYFKIMKINVSVMNDILERFFYPFNELPSEDKHKLSSHYGPLFCNTERSFRTYLNFEPGDDVLIMPDGGYVRLSELHLFFKDSKQIISEPEQIAKIFYNSIKYLIINVVPHMRNINMQVEEMVVLMGIFLWNDSIELSEQILNKVKKVRNEIIIDLHKYYRGIGLNEEEISLKIANLFLIVPKIENVVKMMQENAFIINVFKLMSSTESIICSGI